VLVSILFDAAYSEREHLFLPLLTSDMLTTYKLYACILTDWLGDAENADWKTRDQMTGVENAGLENVGPTKYGKPKVT